MLKLKNVSSGYVKKQVLHSISLSAEKGKITTVLGKNGCGKSTLLKAVLGVLPVFNGEITLDGMAVSQMTNKDKALRIAYLAQGKSVPDMTVGQLVLHGRFAHLGYPRIYRKSDKEKAMAAMERMDIDGLIDKDLSSLSGGMRQKAYIAMTLAQETDYILLDEPTSFLDAANKYRLMDILKDLAESGKGILTVLHDIPLAMEYSDKLLLMRDGKVVFDGTPEAVYYSDAVPEIFGVNLKRAEKENGFTYYCEKINSDLF